MGDTGPLGARIKRLEDGRLLQGAGSFVDDLQPEGCLYVSFLRSPFANGRFAGIETAAARASPGVRAVFTAADLDGSCLPLTVHLTTPGALSPERPVLARDRVRFVGDLMAAVVAESRYQAADAVELLQPEIEILPAVMTCQEALADQAATVHESMPNNIYFQGHNSYGEVQDAFDRADLTVDVRVTHPRVSPAPMECRGVMAVPGPAGEVIITTSTQVPHLVADAVAECLGLSKVKVRVVAADTGGGFGGKAQAYPEEILLAWIALHMKAPVKWIETRSEHMQSASHARDQEVQLSAAVRKDGRVVGLRAKIYSNVGAYGIRPFGPLLDAMGCASLLPGPYDIRNYEFDSYAIATNKCPEGPYRGVGMVTAVLAHERLMDQISSRLQLDPADVRRVNFVQPAQMPYTAVTGHPYESGDYRAALKAALDAIDYPSVQRQRRRARARGRLVGIGLCSYVEYTGAGSSTYIARGTPDIPGTDTARVWLAADGHVHVQTTCPAIGQGSHTTFAQVAAAALGVEPGTVLVEQTDTAEVGHGSGSFMSRGSVTAATAVFRAATLFRELAEEGGELDVTVTYDAVQASHPYATHTCLVEVDRETGAVTILRYVVAEDCGALINPMIVEGQVVGGVAQGLGAAVMEEVAYGADGQLLSGTFLDYLIPSVGEAPDVEVVHLVTPSTVHELGTKGAGEGGTIGATAAVTNAIADALGLADVALPLTPDRILSALM